MLLRRRLSFESLEARQLLAVDLTVVDVQFVDPTDWFGSATGVTPVEGQKIALRADIGHSDLATGTPYKLRYEIDGVAIDVDDTLPGFSPFSVVRDGWVARPDVQHTVTVTIDPDDSIAEMDETNNVFTFQFTPDAPTSLPQKFINPLEGEVNVDWVADGYVDVDPEFCFDCDEDYRGNTSLTRDFHNGIDFRIVNFAQADRGVDVLAAANGTVILAQDGNFDRWSSFQGFPPPDGNRVFVDHGDGWVSQYYHLQRDSVTVSNGDPVVAGQAIGRVGSSGNSAAAHLHFEVQRHNLPVEPFVSPADYFVDPVAYAYDEDPGLLDLGITTEFSYFRDIVELPSVNDALPAQSISISPWVILSSIEPGDTWEVKIYTPSNVEIVQHEDNVPITFPSNIEGSWQWSNWWNVFLDNPEAGNWRAEVLVNDTVVGEETFIVGRDLPELRLFEDTNANGLFKCDINNFIDCNEPLIIDGRRTPLDFGEATQGSAAPTKQFIVENHGSVDLTISAVEIPTGFSITEPLNTTIAPGGSDTFTIAMDTASAGALAGTVKITSNDHSAADLDGDGDVDGSNFLAWQRGNGTASGATVAEGDVNGDGAVDGDDLDVLLAQYASSTETLFEFHLEGEVTAPLAAAAAPELAAYHDLLFGRLVNDFEDALPLEEATRSPLASTSSGAALSVSSADAEVPRSVAASAGETASVGDDVSANAVFEQLGLEFESL